MPGWKLAVIDDSLEVAREKMEKALEVVREDLATVQVSRARPALVENIKVSAYEGSLLTIRELANITTPDWQQIIINPWDKSIIKKIAQAISEADLKLTPIVEEEMIRLKLPPLTEERLREAEKLIEVKTESGRKIVRAIRNEAKSEIIGLKGQSGISEDDVFQALKRLQELHDEFVGLVEELAESKKKELG